MPPIIISIEGIIGAGKSTFIELIKTIPNMKIGLFHEPVDEWKDILPLFYNDPKRWSYTFQMYAFYTKIKNSMEFDFSDYDVIITERSIYSDGIFMNMLYESGNVSDIEMELYNKWWSLWKKDYKLNINAFIYLNVDISTAMQRVISRNRDGEDKITYNYQEQLKVKHDSLFLHSTAFDKPVFVISSQENYKNDVNEQKKIIEQFECIFNALKHN